MDISICQSAEELGAAAAHAAAGHIRDAIRDHGDARIVVATGTSQFETLAHLVREDLPWSKVTAFHLDEYVGLPAAHRASFRAYLRERFVSALPDLGAFHEIDGEAEPEGECARLAGLIGERPIDLLLGGIGENGHLAFNDPPADFETNRPYLVVKLDDACRRQQVNEGWFESVADVPSRAISMGIRQILAAAAIVVSVPDRRKAEAVRCSVAGPVTPLCPSSILQQHPLCTLFLDRESASLIGESPSRD